MTDYPTPWRVVERKQGAWPSNWSVMRVREPGVNEYFSGCQMLASEDQAQAIVDRVNSKPND